MSSSRAVVEYMSDFDAAINDRMVVLRARLCVCVGQLSDAFDQALDSLTITGIMTKTMRKHRNKTNQVNAGWMQRYTQKVRLNKF